MSQCVVLSPELEDEIDDFDPGPVVQGRDVLRAWSMSSSCEQLRDCNRDIARLDVVRGWRWRVSRDRRHLVAGIDMHCNFHADCLHGRDLSG